MNVSKKKTRVLAGVDWGHESHAVAVVSEEGKVLEQFTVTNCPKGYTQMCARLSAYEQVRGIAVESTRHSLLLHLMKQGYVLYLINPKLSKAWRDTDTVSGAKSDERDGRTLARGLAFRYETLEPVRPGNPALEHLALLCEKECGFIQKRTALVQELQSVLRLYYPAALDFFSDWTKATAWDFLRRFPTPDKLVRAREHTLVAFLKGHRLGRTAHWESKLKGRKTATDWPAHPHESLYEMHALALVEQLKAVEAILRKFRREIETAFKDFPQAQLLQSLPGAGKKLAPRLMAIVASPEAQHGGLAVVCGHSGVAPVTEASGKRRYVHIRRMCNKHWRNTLHLFAWCSTKFSRWAKAFYQYRKDKGDTHSTALRKLAGKWLKIIMRMMETNQAYDEEKYLRILEQKNSPTWQYLNNGACG